MTTIAGMAHRDLHLRSRQLTAPVSSSTMATVYARDREQFDLVRMGSTE